MASAAPDGIESFRLAAERALRDQRVLFDMKQRDEDLIRLSAENKELKLRMREMITSMDANIEDRERVILYKVKKINELQDKIARLETDETGRMEEAVQVVSEQIVAVTNERDGYRAKCIENEEFFQEMKAFELIKGDVEKEIARLRTENKRIEDECQNKVRELETKHIVDLQRMKREREEAVARTRREMEKMMVESLDGTTRRAVEENEKLTLELRYQSSKLEKLIRQNEEYKREKVENRNNTDILTEMTETLSKKVKFYEKLFVKMQHKERIAMEQQLQEAQIQAQEKRTKAKILFNTSTKEPPVEPQSNSTNTPDLHWQVALDQHLEERYKARRGIDVVLQYNQFIQNGDLLESKRRQPQRKAKTPVTGSSPNRGRRTVPVQYTPQVIESIRLPHIVEVEPKSYLPKAEFLDSTSPSRRRDGSKTARI